MSVREQLMLAHEMAGAGLLPKDYCQQLATLLFALQYAEALPVHPRQKLPRDQRTRPLSTV